MDQLTDAGRRAPATAPPHVARLRRAISLFFALDGFVFAGWVVRIPAIKEQIHASAGALGLALLGVSVGSVATMLLTGKLCRRYGNHPVTVVTAALLSLSVALPPLTHSALHLGLVLLLFGAAYGGLNVAFNAAAVDLAEAVRRPILPSFHAAFSAGGLVGAGLGGLLAPQLSPLWHLLLLTATGLVVTAYAGRVLLRTPGPPATGQVPRRDGTDAVPGRGRAAVGRTRLFVTVYGLITLCTAYGEGALADWGSLHLSADLHTGPGAAAAGYAVFALLMTVSRMSGTWLLERLGDTPVLVAGGLLAAVGMLVGSLAPQLWLVYLGYALTGLGLANVFPVAVGGAGALAGPHGVAVASTLGYSGILLGPPSIGFLAEAYGLPGALTTIAALAALAALLGRVVGRGRPRAPR
ncbi:MFS transporter [Streptomyces sp. Isolate_219]|uniref:MFS transporter n=1 Tax=Streptomyces sp. Isolate_219 TaxID=2950110 RepID=UPI0021C935A6|nr:MFS transporter [Streptomyces sp. Isolate_219]MCR8573163.1 MFS transporter [Streptomyces sp. Isolate_219]